MKFKLDENFGPAVHEVFRLRGLDCATVAAEGLGGMSDATVLTAAVAEDRVLVTLDRDFTNILVYPPETTCGIAVVQPGRRSSRQFLAGLLDSFLEACGRNQIRGKLWIIEPGRIREHKTDESGGQP